MTHYVKLMFYLFINSLNIASFFNQHTIVITTRCSVLVKPLSAFVLTNLFLMLISGCVSQLT